MPVRAIDHVQLAMPAGGEERATMFYDALLGLSRVDKPAHLARRGGCWFGAGSVRIHLGVEADFRPARKAHPALIVDSLDELVSALAGAGYVVSADAPLEGFERVYVDDPFGNRIELLEPASR
jgi:catechol 2,3-dioxygenase-like lactoylglutathione lyase family enzyme